MRSSIATALFVLLTASACAGDPDLGESAESLEEAQTIGTAVERARWQVAIAGCEGASRTLSLHAAGGEPLLGVLVDGHGAPVCVDAMSLLRRERSAYAPIPTAYEPDPTPTPIVLGPHEDPTPTPTIDTRL